jgi:hypothetical protein
MTQLTIDLPDTTYQVLKKEAQRREESINNLIIGYLSSINITPINAVQDNWSADFFANTAGCFADEPLERAPQGDYEQRLELL